MPYYNISLGFKIYLFIHSFERTAKKERKTEERSAICLFTSQKAVAARAKPDQSQECQLLLSHIVGRDPCIKAIFWSFPRSVSRQPNRRRVARTLRCQHCKQKTNSWYHMQASGTIYFLLLIFIYLKDRNQERVKDFPPTGHSSNAHTAGAWPGQSQDPQTPKCTLVSQDGGSSPTTEPSPLPPRVHLSRKLNLEVEPGLKPRHTGCSIPNILTTVPNTPETILH